ncbi:MAG: AgmX/PglI C-terminal domain-containing protein [Polyangiaceae bacterium]
MSNASPPPESGPRDRLVAVIDFMRANRERFRTCFDVWGADHPGKEGSLLLALELDQTGKLKDAHVDRAQSTVTDSAVETCAIQAAKALEYPASPSGKETLYSELFRFKANASSSQKTSP